MSELDDEAADIWLYLLCSSKFPAGHDKIHNVTYLVLLSGSHGGRQKGDARGNKHGVKFSFPGKNNI